jgi:hypothetical protein
MIAGSMNCKIIRDKGHGPDLLNTPNRLPEFSACYLAGVAEEGIHLLEDTGSK